MFLGPAAACLFPPLLFLAGISQLQAPAYGQHNPAISLMGASYLTWFPPSSASLVQPELSAPWQSSSTPFWVSLFHLQLSSAPSSLGFTSLPVSTPPRRSSLCTLQGLLVPDPAPSFWVLLLLTWVHPPQAVSLPSPSEVSTSCSCLFISSSAVSGWN